MTSLAYEQSIITRVCDPCAGFEDETEATATVRFVINGKWHTMDVCPGHEQMWLEQFNDWRECATPLDHQPHDLSHELAATDPELYRALGDPTRVAQVVPQARQDDPRRMRVVPPEAVIKTDIVINRDEPRYDLPVAGEVPLQVVREWGLTDHARQRMEERGISIQEVWRALHQTRRADLKPDPEGGSRIVVGDLCVVVNPDDKVVLTVFRPSSYSAVAAAAAAALGGRY